MISDNFVTSHLKNQRDHVTYESDLSDNIIEILFIFLIYVYLLKGYKNPN